MFTAASDAKKICLTLILALSVTLVGCASAGKKTADTETAYYETAQQYLEKRNYSLAIERLNELQNRFPFGRYTSASQLDLMYAHYQTKDFSSALIEADRFTRLNADHPNVDYAWFVRAMSYYELFLANRGLFGKVDPAKRSAEQGDKAFRALTNYTSQFPDSPYRADALSAMVILKDALARHELVVADYYIRRGAWIAAAERAQVVVEHYPGVSAVADAYVVLIEAYDALSMPDDRAIVLDKLTTQYPEHASLSSGTYTSPKWEEDRWWLKVLTLGITS